jgi:translation initiation factor IF-3
MVAKYNRKRNKRGRKHYINNRIRANEVRLINQDGENLGVIETKNALKMAREQDLDLVLITEKANPPVAKILDYTKFLYIERKKQSAAKTKSSKSETKEFVIGPAIGEGDLDIRIERTREFIEEGNRVKWTVRLRGRERAHPEVGMEKLEKAVKMLSDVARVEEEPKFKGPMITTTFVKK